MSKVCCPHCGKEINISALLGAISSEAKAEASRRNGASGGAPKRDFEFTPNFELVLDDGTTPDFYYRRGEYLHWITRKEKGKPQLRVKTNLEGGIVEVLKFSGRVRKLSGK